MTGEQVLGAAAVVVSVSAFLHSMASTVAQRRRANMEIARSLHVDLTTGPVEEARRPLGEIAFSAHKACRMHPDDPDYAAVVRDHPSEPEDVRHQYFVLLWCFERLWHGHEVITSDRLLGQRGGRHFADMIRWHVRTWAWSLPAVKKALEPSVGDIKDADSVKAFAKLTDVVLQPEDHRFLRRRLEEMGLSPIGNPRWPTQR